MKFFTQLNFKNINLHFKSLLASKFAVESGGLMVGSALAQAIGIATVSVMARVFTQDDIGVFYVLVSYTAVIGTFSLLSYHLALPSADDSIVGGLFYGMLFILVSASLLVLVLFFVTGYSFPIPVALLTFSGGLVILSESLNLRDRRIKLMTLVRILFTLPWLGFLLFVLFFLQKPNAQHLIWGNVFVNLIYSFIYAGISFGSYIRLYPGIKNTWYCLKSKAKNPLLLTPGDVLNSLTYNLPVILMEKYFGASFAASYGIILRFFSQPISLIGGTLGKVYFSSLGQSVRSKDASAYNRYKKFRNYMLIISIVFGVFMFSFGPILIRILLGPGWEASIMMVRIFTPMYAIMLFVTPLSMLFYVLDQQRFLLAVQILYFLISCLSFGLGIWLESFWIAISLFAGLSFLRYLLISGKISAVSVNLKQSE